MDKMPVTQSWIEQIFEQQIDWDVDCQNACFVSGEFENAIAAQHEQEVTEARKHTWKEAEAHFAPYVAADDASFRLFEQYSEGGGLTPAETLEKVAEVLGNLCNALAEQIDRAVAAEEENAELVARAAVMSEALGFVRNAIGQAWKADRELRDRGGILAEQFAQVIDALGSCSERAEQALSAAPKVWRVKGRTSKYYDLEVVADDAPEEFRQLLIGRGMFAAWDVIVCPPKGEQPPESEQGKEEREDG